MTTKSSFFEALQQNNADKIQTILEAFPSFANEENEDGLTPLGLAGHFGLYEIVSILVQHGANPNTVSHSKVPFIPSNTALHATIAGSKNLDIIRLLLDSGSSTEIMDSNGFLPIHLCAFDDASEEVIELLIEFGASTLSLTADGRTMGDIAKEQQKLDVLRFIESKTQ